MVHSIIGEQIEKRFIAGHFEVGNAEGLPEPPVPSYVKGYILSPTPEISKEDALHANITLTCALNMVLLNKKEVREDFNGLGTAIATPASGYYILTLWKEKNQIECHPFEWHLGNILTRIEFAPCSRELAILGEESSSHYMPLLKSPCGKEDMQKYKMSWLPNKELI